RSSSSRPCRSTPRRCRGRASGRVPPRRADPAGSPPLPSTVRPPDHRIAMLQSPAAILTAPHMPFVVDTLEVAPPRAGEVLVEIVASGLCHTDLTAIEGSNASCVYPAVLGHEGAGRVVEVGPGVQGLRAGDHVIPLYGPECGTCRMCLSRRT